MEPVLEITVTRPPTLCRFDGCSARATWIAADERGDSHTYACTVHLGAVLAVDRAHYAKPLAIIDAELRADLRPWRSKVLAGAVR